MIQRDKIFSFSLSLTLLVIVFIFIFQNFMYLPINDGLDLMVYINKWYENELSFYDIFAVHRNSHWHAPAYMLLLISAILTKWNTYLGIMLSVITALGSCFLVYKISKEEQLSQTIKSKVEKIFVVPVAMFWLLSMDQGVNWQWEWQLSVHLNIFASIYLIWLLTRARIKSTHQLLALFMLSLAIYNYTTGLILIPIALICIATHRELTIRQKVMWSIVWGLCSVLIVQHFIGVFEFAVERAGESSSWLMRGAYSFIYLGGALTRDLGSALMLGMLGTLVTVVLFSIIFHHQKISAYQVMPWIMLALYAVGASWITGFDRARFGIEHALLERYITFANLLWLANSMLLLIIVEKWRLTRNKNSQEVMLVLGQLLVIIFIVVVLKVNNIHSIWLDAKARAKENDNFALLLKERSIDSIDEAIMLRYYPDAAIARELYKAMQKHELNIFGK